MDLRRVTAISDGIFAFAMTLLVLTLVVPAGFDSSSNVSGFLWRLWPAFLAYLLSFLIIYLYWREHTLVFRYLVSFDWTLSNLNIAFLLCIAVMPFVTELLAVAGQSVLIVWLYAANLVAASLLLLALWKYANGTHRHTEATLPKGWDAYLVRSLLVVPIVFAAASPLALWNPYATEAAWFIALPAVALFRYRARRVSVRAARPPGVASGR